MTTTPDGTTILRKPDGETVGMLSFSCQPVLTCHLSHFSNSATSKIHSLSQLGSALPLTRKVQTNPDGSTITTKTNGVKISAFPNGGCEPSSGPAPRLRTHSFNRLPGQNCIEYTDNRRVQVNPDGTKLEVSEDSIVDAMTCAFRPD